MGSAHGPDRLNTRNAIPPLRPGSARGPYSSRPDLPAIPPAVSDGLPLPAVEVLSPADTPSGTPPWRELAQGGGPLDAALISTPVAGRHPGRQGSNLGASVRGSAWGITRLIVGLVQDLRGRDFASRLECIRASIDTAEAHRLQLGEFGVEPDDLQPTVLYVATLRLLRDLVLQCWTAGTDDEDIYIPPPLLTAAGGDPSDTKSELRNPQARPVRPTDRM